MHTLPFKSLGQYDSMSLKLNTVKTVILWNIIIFKIIVFYVNILSNVIYFGDAKLNFQHHWSSLQCHMIFRNVLLKKHYILSCSKQLCSFIFCNALFLMKIKFKRTAFIISKIFCNIINVFTVTFEKFVFDKLLPKKSPKHLKGGVYRKRLRCTSRALWGIVHIISSYIQASHKVLWDS